MATRSNFSSQQRVPLPGSERTPFPSTITAGAAAPRKRASTATVTVSVIVRSKQTIPTQTLSSPDARLTRAQYARIHGADPDSARLIKQFAKEFNLAVASAPDPCTLRLSGSVGDLERAFGVSLSSAEVDGSKIRTREGAIFLPEELSGHILAVLGLDNRPQAQAQFRIASPKAAGVSYTPPQIAQLYSFPGGQSAAGQTIGLIELGGGYRTADLAAYFKTLGMPAPGVTAVSVDGAKNTPTTASGADGEVMLDIEVCAAVAPGAKVAVYFAPNTDQGFVDAISTAIHDTTNKPSVVSISWGAPESSWTAQAMATLDGACQAAALLGVTITVASGDNGSSDGVTDSANHVDFPASSPHVLACGGTTLTGSGTSITDEVVWNETAAQQGATGGGVSDVFPLPSWQSAASVPAPAVPAGGRGVPDVAGDADPSTGYIVRVDGQTLVIGGTSAVAPLWAGLIAVANAQNGTSAGFINPLLYGAGGAGAFRDITQGNNGAFNAGPGWDACTGLGSPIGTGVVKALGGSTPPKAPKPPKGPKPPTKKKKKTVR